jgi:Domain of unknown function (DUF4190)
MAVNEEDDRPRGRRDDDGDDRDERPRRRRRDEYEDAYDDAEDRRTRRRRNDGDATGGVIPYKNPKALASYYCGVFGLISCFVLLGLFGIIPVVLGFMGLSYAKQHPEAKGQAHAIVGIVLGIIEVLTFIAQLGIIIMSIVGK